MLAVLLERKEAGNEFGRWPLHVTLIPWFKLEKPVQELSASIQHLLDTFQQFSVKVGSQKQWGRNTVFTINSPALHALHNGLLQLINQEANITAPMRFVGEDFQPHITQKAYATVQPGFSVTIKKIYLIEAPKTKPIDRIKRVVSIGNLR